MKNKGFTLVEILAVVAIIAILSASAVLGVNAIINRQRQNLANEAEKHISEAALSYFSTKKNLYVEACRDTDKDFTNISPGLVKKINDNIRSEISSLSDSEKEARIKEFVNKINNDNNEKKLFNDEYLFISNIGCFRVVSVKELIDKGLLEDNDDLCNKNSIVIVYQKGDSKDSIGSLKAVHEPQVCNGKK